MRCRGKHFASTLMRTAEEAGGLAWIPGGSLPLLRVSLHPPRTIKKTESCTKQATPPPRFAAQRAYLVFTETAGDDAFGAGVSCDSLSYVDGRLVCSLKSHWHRHMSPPLQTSPVPVSRQLPLLEPTA